MQPRPIAALKRIRAMLAVLAFIAAGAQGAAAQSAPSADSLSPLEIHMYHWLRGSREWRTDNPGYDPAAEPMTGSWFKEFAVRWEYGPHKQHLVGGIYAIAADGGEVTASTMYAFYDPVKNRVEQVQIGRTGGYSLDSAEPRAEPTPFGEQEIGIAVEHHSDGSTTMRKHENTFYEDGRQVTNVFVKDDIGNWNFQRNWVWRLTPQDKEPN